jgi:ribonuclease HI
MVADYLRHTFFVDASCDCDRGVVGIGGVLRATAKPGNRPGPVVATFCESYVGVPMGQAEKFAVLRALEIATDLSLSRVKIRSDVNSMRRALKRDHARGTWLDGSFVHRRILNLARMFEEVKFAYVPRRKNNDAHQLARRAVRECSPVGRSDIDWSGDHLGSGR